MKHEFEGEFWESLWNREHKDHEEREEDAGESEDIGEVGEAGEVERVDEAWMNRLDAIASGEELPSTDDDELLHVAGQLSAALTPLRTLDSNAEARQQRVSSHLRTRRVAQSLKVWGRRSLVFAAALLIFLLLGPGLIFMVNFNLSAHRGATTSASPTGQTTRGVPVLPAPATRFDLIRISQLPAHEHLIDSGLDFVAGTFFRYYAQYRITGQGEQDIFFYEQPSLLFAFPQPATGGQAIIVHGLQGVTFRNDTGYYTIRWTQDNLTCQLASLLPTSTLLAFSEQFEVVTVEHKAVKR